MKKGQLVELSIEKFADRGKSLARAEGIVVFVPGAVPGDRIQARIRRKKKSFAEATIESIVEASPLRVEPRCRYAAWCGGCKWQHVSYEAQLGAKQESVQDALRGVPGADELTVESILPAERIYAYRNKMEFSFSANRWLTPQEIASGERFDRSFALGLHAPGSFDRVLDLEECHLQSSESVRIVNETRLLARAREWTAWSTRDHEGLLRHLVIRQSRRTGDLMVNLVTSDFDDGVANAFSETLRERVPEITTVVNTVNRTVAQTALGEECRVLYGPGTIIEELGGYRFELAPAAFFQTNTGQAERLYELILDMCGLTGSEHVYDLYCGVGSIALFLSRHAASVVGVEVVPDSVRNARVSAEANGVTNCRFVEADMTGVLDDAFVTEHGVPDLVVVDPPRAGMHPKSVRSLMNLGAPRVVYVSCNPRTQARDLETMADVYRLRRIRPVDMFPHTHHVETVALLERSEPAR